MFLHGKEDIYESEDLPESANNEANNCAREEVSDPEHLELVHIDIDAAKKRFEGRVLNCKDVDFSDSIAKKRLKAYGSSSYVLEVVGREYEKPETPEQKFNRLTFEINELSDMIKDQNVAPIGLVTDSSINQLLDELKGVRVAKVCGQALEPKQGNKSERKNVKLTDDKFLSLEQRVSRIESLIGPIDSTRQPLADAVEDLRFRTEAFNPAYVEGMEIRLNTIITKLEQVEDKKEKTIDSDMEAKVDELHSLMYKWDTACAALPSNLRKLQGLHRLHEQAQHFSERLSHLAGMRDQVEKAIAADRITMCELQVRAKEDISALLKRMASLDERVKKLGK